MMTLTEPTTASQRMADDITPPPIERIEDTGISQSTIEALILKTLFFRGEMLGRDLASALGLQFSVIQGLVDSLKRIHAIQVKRSMGMGDTSAVFALADNGRALAKEHLEKDQYIGPVPVPMNQYECVVRLQRPPEGWLSKPRLAKAYQNMVITDRTLTQIGPAISSGNSLLIYGQPGNGKTYMAEALQNIVARPVFIPYAVECKGKIVQIFDPVFHHQVDAPQEVSIFRDADDSHYDERWAKCKRPFIVTGGELALDMLDLSFNPTSRVYDAPFQVKANNGIYLIDDFGRQRVSPAELLNRWIIPMERRVDYLSFESGGKISMPFEAFLIFSTNLKPEDLGDEAFLRRMQYKMLVRSPEPDEFLKIFESYSESKGLAYAEGLPQRFVQRFYLSKGKAMRRCQPRDVISHAINLIHFEKLPFELTEPILEQAFESCFGSDIED